VNEPPEDAYCTDQPATFTSVAPRLWSSMKSFVYVASELPPPPYTWLITMDPLQRFGLVVVKPVGCVNGAGSGMLLALFAAVVTRIL